VRECSGLPERDVPTTPKEATGVQSQRMQISLECARDAAGLPLVNEDPPAEISAKAKSLIQRVCIPLLLSHKFILKNSREPDWGARLFPFAVGSAGLPV